MKINNIEYNCVFFEFHKNGTVEHLEIVLKNKQRIKHNRLFILCDDIHYYGCKVLVRYDDNGDTRLLVYIYQEGDSEL